MEEANLLELSLEEAIESQPPRPPPPRPHSPQPPLSTIPPSSVPPSSSSSFDPFASWETRDTASSSTAGVTFANFGIFDTDPPPPPPSSSVNPLITSSTAGGNVSFDPFSSSAKGSGSSDLLDLMGATPLLPSTGPTPTPQGTRNSPTFEPNMPVGFGSHGQSPARSSSWSTLYTPKPPPPSQTAPGQFLSTAAHSPKRKFSDPFADLGNMTGFTKAPPPQSKQPQIPSTVPTVTNRPTHQYHRGHTPAGVEKNSSRSPSPRSKFTSVVGDREERGTRPKYGEPGPGELIDTYFIDLSVRLSVCLSSKVLFR